MSPSVRRRRLPRRSIAVAVALMVATSLDATSLDTASPATTFNADFIHSTGGRIDLSRFEHGNVTLPGVYQPLIVVNGEPLPGNRDIAFRETTAGESAQPCFDRTTLLRFGLDPVKLAARSTSRLPTDGSEWCGSLSTIVPGATVAFDEGEQTLRVTLPQAFMTSRVRGYVSPDLWDAGETAAMLDYNANSYQAGVRGRRATSTYIGLNAGANIAGWRLRQTGALSIAAGRRAWRNTLVYARHDLTGLRAQLTVGELYSSGDILDSVRIRGAGIASDPRMLPASQRGYAPVIRGVAEGNAQVTVRQSGYVIHSATVAPGAFEIDDLYPTGYGSDLEVTVTEADGRSRTTIVPYTAVPQMVREGHTQFALWAGKLTEVAVAQTPSVVQATVQHGVTVNSTLYVGGIVSDDYAAGLIGTAVNLPFGAVALDATGSRATWRDAHTQRGVSTRLRYSHTFGVTGTSFGLAAYRFSTRNYLGVADAARWRSQHGRGVTGEPAGGERSRFEANAGQSLGSGRVSLIASLVDYWGVRSRSVDYTVGYGSRWRLASYNVSLQRSRVGRALTGGILGDRRQDGTDTLLYASVSVPLGPTGASPNLGMSYNRSGPGDAAFVATLNGKLPQNDDLTYTLAATRTASDGSSGRPTGSGNLAYRTRVGTYRGSASRGAGDATQFALGATGAVVAHRDGITFSPELGETNAIVHAPGAAGSRIESHEGVRLDRHGNAVIRGMQPYQLNVVSIDPRGASADVRLHSSSEAVAPRAGALARLDYATTVANALLIHATRPGGKPLPFGATVVDQDGQTIGVVGQGSKVFTRGAVAGARLRVTWADGSCRIDLPASLDALPIHGLHRAVRSSCEAEDGIASHEKAA